MKLVSVIEDDHAFAKVLEQHLKALGYEAAVYHSGSDFFSKQKTKPYAIILDHYLNEASTGLDYLSQIRKKMSGVPVIYLTALGKEHLPTNLSEIGVHAYIGKDSASLLRLRTILDNLTDKKSNWFQRLLSKF
jgi:two-component system, OmpR family, response regulator VicR